MFDQIENFQQAIRKKKARIVEINLVLSQPLRPGVTAGSRRRLIEERIHLEQAVEELETEVHRLEFQKADKLFQFDQIDQRLLSAKTNDLVEEMSRRIAKEKRRIEFEAAQNGNTSSFTPRWFDFMEQMADERSARLYQAYCDTWVQQNRVITPTFVRAFRDRVLAHVFAGITSSVSHGVATRALRQGRPVNSVVLGDWSRRMLRLKSRWNRKLEADAVATEYRAHRPEKSEQIFFPRPRPAVPNVNELSTAAEELPAADDLEEVPSEMPDDVVRRRAVIKKVQNPDIYTAVSIAEASLYFEVVPRTIFRWLVAGELRDGGRRGSVTVKSIRQREAKQSRKRRSN